MPPYCVERHPAQQEAQENHPWAISISVCRLPVQGSIASMSTTRPSIGSIWARGCASTRHCVLKRWTRVFPCTTAPCRSKALAPAYQVRSVCTDGWEATRQAWRGLFHKITVVLCFLHAILKMKKYWAGQWRQRVLDRAWQVYQAATTRQFAQRLRRVAEWTPAPLSGAVAQRVLKRCRRRSDFAPAYDGPQAHRTSTAVDRRLDDQDRRLDAMRYWHGTTDSARLAVRAMALQWNFHPYGTRLRRDQPSRAAPFHDLNGLQYHSSWLHTLLIASSMGGLRH